MGRAKIISFINYKGGVGKTTSTYHIGCSLAYHYGKRVLLVDIDPQTNLTFLCVDLQRWERFKQSHGTIVTLYKRFKAGKPLETKRYIWRSPVGSGFLQKIPNVDLLPCDLDLIGEDLGGVAPVLATSSSGNPFRDLSRQAKQLLREYLFLKEALAEVEDDYDYILIDCPPNLYLMTQNALVASHKYVVTTIPEYLSLIGLTTLVSKVNTIRERIAQMATLAGKDVGVAELGGIIFVKVRLGGSVITNQHDGQMKEIRRRFGDMCFDQYTTELIGYSEAAESRLPVWLTSTRNARNAAAKQEYELITAEFIGRFS